MTARAFKNIAYNANSSDPEQTLDLYLPPTQTTTPLPLLVYIHGGAWRSGDKNEYESQANFWATQTTFPMAVAVINYRLSKRPPAEPFHHPNHLLDCAAAITFLRSSATTAPSLGSYDPDKMYLVGHSCGAQLDACLVLQPQWLDDAAWRGVKGVMGVQGIYDVPQLIKTWPSYRDFIEMAFGAENGGGWEAGSPQFMPAPTGRALPIYWVVHSPEDELVDKDQAQMYFNHLKTLHGDGVQVVLEQKRLHLHTSVSGKHFEMLKEQKFLEVCVEFMRVGEGAL
ncbi:alpha/beta-hydrolase [Gonapodya prolifera JEL478]|uniref:Alpha/beta-hydrolase n=1 Tax=Gonapodya prolifera (strain JEL478) TaxID=1344416 RepID=A0A139AK37_GONPJ|nr:alpha/beta-hydrolase [Gonapodya prolifera JEL478]|eukprot:KXS17141.1 alpha/beta-hydrolase [Gonapodya prolifera JEL478]